MRKDQAALVAFGANVALDGKSLAGSVLDAAAALDAPDLTLRRISWLYATPCFPPGAGPDYVNAVALYDTDLDAAAVLARLHGVEAAFGRDRAVRWGQRTLDLDLLALGDNVLPDVVTQDHWRALDPAQQAQIAPDQLILPHPRLQDRAFVLVPMADVAPDWRHPRLGQTVLEMLSRLQTADIAAVTPL